MGILMLQTPSWKASRQKIAFISDPLLNSKSHKNASFHLKNPPFFPYILSARGTRALIHLAFFFVILFSALLQIFAYSYKYMLVSGLYVSVHVSKSKLVSVSAS